MDFLKKNYEKVLLGVVLLGLVVGAVFLLLMIPAERAYLKAKSDEIIKRPAKALPDLDLGSSLALIQRPSVVDLTATNKVFNPVQWQRKPDGSLIKLSLGNEVGPEAVVVTRIVPLYLKIKFESVETIAGAPRYVISVEKEAAPKPAQRTRKQSYATLNVKTDTFVVREVHGAADQPTDLVLELTDGGDRITVKPGETYQRVDGYLADFRYPPESKSWNAQRVGAGGPGTSPISFAGESYIVVAITKNEVVLSAKSNNKKTPRPFTPAP